MVKKGKRKIRVGILVYDMSKLRGGTKLALTLGNQLKKAGCEVAYSCVYEKIKEMEKFFGEKYNFKIYKPKKVFFGKKLAHYIALWNHREPTIKLIKEFKPDVVIEIGGIITSLIPAIQKNIPTIHYCTMPVSKYSKINTHKVNFLSKIQLKLFSIIEKVLINRIDYLITMCQFTENLVKSMWKKESTIINPPTDINAFKQKGKKKDIILSVCRYEAAYKLEDLIKTFRRISKNYPSYELHITAELPKKDVPYFNHIKSLIKPKEKIFLHYNLSFNKLLELYNKAKIFWYTSFTHFGLIFVEAQASGIPVIAFQRGGGVEEIILNKKTGFLVKNFDELYKKTIFLIKNQKLLQRMSRAARINAKRFSNEVFRKKIMEVINKTLRIR